MTLWLFFAAAVLLSLERICYLWIWYGRDSFRRWCAIPLLAWVGAPVDVLRFLFYGFKLLQCSVFLAWCFLHGNASFFPLSGNIMSMTFGIVLVLIGQIFNASVFYRLGKVGVFYGNKLGHQVSWSTRFPFSCLEHPQYAGALLSIWGFFVFMRFPHNDWYMLPALETVYYFLGAYLER